jgi:hypothetical protein
MEFHFGLCMTTVVDIRIDAESAEEAQEKFAAASADEEAMKALPKAILDKQYEVLGMIEGPMPTPPGLH